MIPDQPLPPGHCPTDEHRLHRRLFLRGLSGGALASVTSFTGLFHNPAFAHEVKRAQKRCILLWLCGAPSQFETWDPKPGRPSSGPFGSIPTSVPGVHFSGLMPQCARIADKLNVVRSMSTSQTEHFQAISLLQRGNPERAGFTRPTLGSVVSHALERLEQPLPNFILLDPIPGGNEFEAFKAGDWSGWLGPEHSPIRLGGDYSKSLHEVAEVLPASDRESRDALRTFLSERYERARNSRVARSYNAAFERLKGLAASAELFDVDRLPERDRERYGPGQLRAARADGSQPGRTAARRS